MAPSKRASEFIQVLALHHDTVRRPLKRFRVVRRNSHIFQAQRLKCLEAEDVADNRGRQIGNRAFFEKIDIISDVSDVLIGAGHGIDPVTLRLIMLVRREAIGPDHGPGCRRRFTGHRCRGFDRIYARLRHQTEGAENVCSLRFVIGVVVAHFRVRCDSCGPTAFLFARTVTTHCCLLETCCLVAPASGRLSRTRHAETPRRGAT